MDRKQLKKRIIVLSFAYSLICFTAGYLTGSYIQSVNNEQQLSIRENKNLLCENNGTVMLDRIDEDGNIIWKIREGASGLEVAG